MDYDFSKLNAKQEWLILYEGWRIGQRYPDGSPWPQPSPSTVKKLIDRELMVPHQHKSGLLSVTEYHVPLDVHLAYCLHDYGKEG